MRSISLSPDRDIFTSFRVLIQPNRLLFFFISCFNQITSFLSLVSFLISAIRRFYQSYDIRNEKRVAVLNGGTRETLCIYICAYI